MEAEIRNLKSWVKDVQSRVEQDLKEIRQVQTSIRNIAWTILGSVLASGITLIVVEAVTKK